MTSHYRSILLKGVFLALILTFVSCRSDDDYTDLVEEPEPVSPVILDLDEVPYQKLSDYSFFEGNLKEQKPVYGVLPYQPASELFTDYALKKRFVWMPKNTKATYNGDHNLFNFPVGTVLIKTFYYHNVLPGNTTRIIETRLMIKKSTGWIFAEYLWDEDQQEAYLDMDGSFTPVEWQDESGELKSTFYRIPSETECLTCHKSNDLPIPIGPKPQNLNFNFTYEDGVKNQLSQWVQKGYLESNLPVHIVSAVNYKDQSLPVELRLRSYLDINCAHCHKEGSHCDYRPIRLALHETANYTNLGVCTPPDQFVGIEYPNIVTPGNHEASVMYYRMNINDEADRMPLLGRNMIHEEGVQLLREWIDNLPGECP